MSDNLFLNSIDSDKLNEINAIKNNKAFALRLINDLGKVFQTNHKVEDNADDVISYMRTSPNHNFYGCFRIKADKNGLFFYADCLGYYSVNVGSHIKPLGAMYEKYKKDSKASDAFISETDRHGHVNIVIQLSENDPMLKEKLKDIFYLMEAKGFSKNY